MQQISTNIPEFIEGAHNRAKKVLLINPPVFETRYEWIRWNQPLDLLKTGQCLRQAGAAVKFFDFMQPDVRGRVIKRKRGPIKNGLGHEFISWRYGAEENTFKKWLDTLQSDSWRPDEIWVSVLTSFWWQPLTPIVTLLKSRWPEVAVNLIGGYPRVETEHACRHTFVDRVFIGDTGLRNWKSDLSLYDELPDFAALQLSENVADEILEKINSGVTHFAFFEENLFIDHCGPLLESLKKIIGHRSKTKPIFHGICGMGAGATEAAIKAMREAGFVEIFLEHEATPQVELWAKHYERKRLGQFVNIGLGRDGLELIIKRMIGALHNTGTVILKPFAPAKGTVDYKEYNDVLPTTRPELLSNHLFPMAEHNGMKMADYDRLFQLATFLNHKVRGTTFDFGGSSLIAKSFHHTLAEGTWDAHAAPHTTD